MLPVYTLKAGQQGVPEPEGVQGVEGASARAG